MSASRRFSLAYLSACHCTAAEAIRVAGQTGYAAVGLRLLPNGAAGPHQPLIDDAAALREALAAQRDTGVAVLDLEIVRIGESFDARAFRPLFETGAALGARHVLVAADDPDRTRLAESYARLCEAMQPFGLTADLEFMPWTEVPDARAAVAVIERAGRPANAGVLVDALHVGRSATTLADLRAIPRDWLHYAQICDASTPAQHGRAFTTDELIHTARCERLLPGEGGIDLAGIFAALPGTLPISVEVVHLKRMAECSAPDWAARCLAASEAYFSF